MPRDFPLHCEQKPLVIHVAFSHTAPDPGEITEYEAVSYWEARFQCEMQG